MPTVRRMIFNIRSISDYRRTPPSLLTLMGKEFVWYRKIILEINLPSDLQISTAHPSIMKKLLQDVPQLSVADGGLSCGKTGDFREELESESTGESLGHVWEHVAAHAFDEVSSRLGYGAHLFVWRTQKDKRRSNANRMIYRMYAFHEARPPTEFFGLEMMVSGYLNALFESKPFKFSKRLDDFVDHRQEKIMKRSGIIKRFLLGILNL